MRVTGVMFTTRLFLGDEPATVQVVPEYTEHKLARDEVTLLPFPLVTLGHLFALHSVWLAAVISCSF